MKRKSNFEKKYPLFVKYIQDETVQKNMLENIDLLRKYQNNENMIQTFLYELDQRFDIETVSSIMASTILKYPDNVLVSFITAYLNSDEATKSNRDVVSFYNKTLSLGTECVKYIEKNGIIVNRHYKELPNIVVDDMYEHLKNGSEKFRDAALDSVYNTLSYPLRKYVVNLLEHETFDILELVFYNFTHPLEMLLRILYMNNIDGTIINKEMQLMIGNDNLMSLCYMLIDTDLSEKIINYLHVFIKNKRYILIKYLVETNLINNIYLLNMNEVNSYSDEEIITSLSKRNVTLLMKEAC